MSENQPYKPSLGGPFKLIYNIFSAIFSPKVWFGDDYDSPDKNGGWFQKLMTILNVIFRFICLICILPAIPCLVVFIISLESLRYFFSKFIQL